MNDLPESLFADPVWHALQTKHRHLAVLAGDARRYPADVAPFAAVAAPTPAALQELQSLLAPGESVWLFGESFTLPSELSFEGTLQCLQMVLRAKVKPPRGATEIVRLSSADAPEMVTLTELAFPGFFRSRTHQMGAYYGVRSGGELVAMGGERMMLDGYPEISGVCTHPAHRGRGLSSGIIWQLAQNHRRDGLVSWLHVSAANTYALNLYQQLGFAVVRSLTLTRIRRVD